MGNTIGTQRLDDLRYYLLDSPDIVVHSLLATYKLFKVFHCAHEGYKHGGVIVKLFIPNVPEEDELHEGSIKVESILKPYRDATFLLQCRFWGLVHPNVIPYESAEILGQSAILMRQYLGRNLFDRLYSQPRLSVAHKKWLSFQILCAVAQMHSVGAIHGDIKSENVFVNGSFHAVLTDMATFIKPVYLPLDDPVAATSLFFESGGKKHRCFIAPERFIDSLTSRVLDEHGRRMTFFDKEFTRDFVRMDLFATGLTIAELYLEGQHVVDLPELLAFRAGGFDLAAVMDKIEDSTVKALVKEMTHKEPKNRPFSAVSCLSLLQSEFSSLLLPLSTLASHPVYANADMRMMLLRANWIHISGNLTDCSVAQYDQFTELEIFEHSIHSSLMTRGVTTSIAPLVAWSEQVRAGERQLFPHPVLSRLNCENFSKSLIQLWESGAEAHIANTGDVWRNSLPDLINETYNNLFVPFSASETLTQIQAADRTLLMALLGSTVAACAWSRSKLVYLDMVQVLAPSLSEDVIADSVMPYVHDLIVSASSENAVKRRAISCLIALVETLNKAETGLFSEYLFPLCLGVDSPDVVRLATALTALAVRLSQPDEGGKKLNAIRLFCERFVSFVTAKHDEAWTIALLDNMKLFDIFDSGRQLNELLLDRASEFASTSPRTRAALYRAVQSVRSLSPNLRQTLLHVIGQYLLTDEPGLAVIGIRAIGRLVGDSGSTPTSTDKLATAAAITTLLPFLYHPTAHVRKATEEVLVHGTKNLSPADQFVFLRTLLPKGCRTLIDLSSARRTWNGLPEELWLAAVTCEPVDVTNIADRDAFGYVKSLVAERRPRSGSVVSVTAASVTGATRRDESSPPPPSHSLSVKTVNSGCEAPWPPLASRLATPVTLSVGQFKDWRVAAADLPTGLPDLGCLSSIDGSYSNLYESSGAATLQRRFLNTLPGVPVSPVIPSPGANLWRPESLLLATLNEFCASGLAVPVVAVDASDDGRVIVAGGADCTLRMWRTNSLETEAVVQAVRVVKPPACSRLYTLKTLRNTKSVAVGADSTVMVFRIDAVPGVADTPVIRSPDHKFGHVMAMDSFDSDFSSSIIFACESGAVASWDIRCNRIAWSYKLDPSQVLIPSAIATAKDAKSFAVSTLAGNVFVFDNRYAKPCRSFSLNSGPISAMTPASGTGSVWISAGSDIGLFNLETGGEPTQLLSVNAGGCLPSTLPVLRPGVSDACMLDNSLTKLTKSEANARVVLECAGATPAQWTLLSGHNDGVVRHWSSTAGESGVAFPIQLEPSPVTEGPNAIAQSPVGDISVDQLDSIAGKPCTITEGHRDVINDMCLASLQYDVVVTAGRDGLIKLWK